MRCFLVLLALVAVVGTAKAADTTRVSLSSPRAELSAISAAPGDFPAVHLVVRALDDSLHPVWDLGVEDVLVREGEERAEVLSVRALGDAGSVRLGLALDFSSSMHADSALLAAHPELRNRGAVLPSGLSTPLDEAKRALTEFAELHPNEFALIAFNDQVYQVVAMGEGCEPMRQAFESMEPMGMTALYDAAHAAVEQVAEALMPGDAGAAIVLTDGQDNASYWQLEDVVDLAQKVGVPIFTIGLGQVDRARLQQLADQTHGRAYFTRESSDLGAIYTSIQRELASYYALTYASPLVASATDWPLDASERFLAIEIVPPPEDLAPEVQAELNALSLLRQYALPTGLLAAAVTATGIALAYRRRRQRSLRIVRLYPNPVSDILNLDLEGNPERVAILSASGSPLLTVAVQAGPNAIDVSALPVGTCIVRVRDGAGQEVAERVVMAR